MLHNQNCKKILSMKFKHIFFLFQYKSFRTKLYKVFWKWLEVYKVMQKSVLER